MTFEYEEKVKKITNFYKDLLRTFTLLYKPFKRVVSGLRIKENLKPHYLSNEKLFMYIRLIDGPLY